MRIAHAGLVAALLVVGCSEVTEAPDPQIESIEFDSTYATARLDGCPAKVAPSTSTVSGSGGSTKVNVTVPTKCGYRIVVDSAAPGMVQVAGGPTFAGSKSITLRIAANKSAARTAHMRVVARDGGRILAEFRVKQHEWECRTQAPEFVAALSEVASSARIEGAVRGTCTWEVIGNSNWASVSPRSGRGPIGLTVRASSASAPREVRLQVQERGSRTAIATLVVRQTGGGTAETCIGSFAAPSTTVASAGGSYAVASSAAGCTPRVMSAPWISVNTPTLAGSTTLGFSVAANAGASRSGSIQLLHPSTGAVLATHSVVQPGVLPPACPTLSLRPSVVPPLASSSTLVTLTLNGVDCTGNVTSSISWARPDLSSFTGTTSLTIRIDANTSTVARSGTVTVRSTTGRAASVLLSQVGAALPCNYVLTPATSSLPARGGTTTYSVVRSGSCPPVVVAASASWMNASIVNQTMRVTATANPSAGVRTGVVRVLDAATGASLGSVSVTQDGSPTTGACLASVAPTALSAGTAFTPITTTITATSACIGWTVTVGANWVQLPVQHFTGSTTLTGHILANPTAAARATTLTFRSGSGTVVVLPITQSGNQPQPPAISVSPTDVSADRGVQQVDLTVTASAGSCYTIIAGASWVTVQNGSHRCGGGRVTLILPFNTGSARSTVVLVGATPVVVTQAGSI